MEIKLLDFVQECKRLTKQALGKRAGEPASGGFARWKHLVLHCIRIEDEYSYRELVDRVALMDAVCEVLELDPDELPKPSTLCKAFDRLSSKSFYIQKYGFHTMIWSNSRAVLEGPDRGSLQTAVLLGLISIPLTLYTSWRGGTMVNISWLVAVGFAVGYLYYTGPVDSHWAGLIAGFVASVGGIVIIGREIAIRIFSASSVNTVELAAIPFVLVLLSLCLAGSVMIFAMVGSWIAKIRVQLWAGQ